MCSRSFKQFWYAHVSLAVALNFRVMQLLFEWALMGVYAAVTLIALTRMERNTKLHTSVGQLQIQHYNGAILSFTAGAYACIKLLASSHES